MGKCIIERPRSNSGAPSAKARDYGRFIHDDEGIDYDGFTHLPVSSKQEGYHKKLGSKSFTDVLGPLHNYLRSSCGRPWNEVYSEIARVIGRGAGWGVRHILNAHLDVAINTYRGVDGNVYSCNKYGIDRVGGFRDDFYVEPETGILRPSTQYRKWRVRHQAAIAAKPIEAIPIGDGTEYRKIAGIWYFRQYVETEIRTPILFRGVVNRYEMTKVLVSEFKRQLGKKQLKDLGLKNH
jgi:hypothetical protein